MRISWVGFLIVLLKSAYIFAYIFKEVVYMQKKKTFSAMEIALLAVLTGSLIMSFIQARLEEGRRR